jgi:hypothetical protein
MALFLDQCRPGMMGKYSVAFYAVSLLAGILVTEKDLFE